MRSPQGRMCQDAWKAVGRGRIKLLKHRQSKATCNQSIPHPKEVIYGDCSDNNDLDERVYDLFGSPANIQSRLVVKGKKIAKERKEAKMRDSGER
jgi:hypothetical protein